MTNFPQIIPEDTTGKIPLHTDIGLDILLAELYKSIPSSKIDNDAISGSKVREAITRWILGFETNPSVVAERQELMRYFLDNPDFVEAVGNLVVYPQPSEHNRYAKFVEHTGMVRRFDTFSESVSTLKNLLEGKETPKTLTELLHSCEEAESTVQEIKSHLNPEFELRVRGHGRYGKEHAEWNSRRKGQYTFDYVLLNKKDNSVIGGNASAITSALELYSYSLANHANEFLKDLERIVEHTLKQKISKNPFVKKDYTVNGSLIYDPEKNTMEGEFHFVREDRKEKGSFSVSIDNNDTPSSFLEGARFAYNYQVISSFDVIIKDFEDTIVELKALSAATYFLRSLQTKEFPLTFPEIVQDGSDADLHIKNMYHPLLAYFSKNGRIVPNDVESTIDNNVRIITGANNNGKTCYMDGIGLSQVMYQAGMPIIADEARIRLKDKILTHYVRPGDIKASQSRFAHECARVLELIQDISNDSLVLCDELFTGTAPQDGEAVSKLVLDSLVRTGTTLFFTTHYHAVADQFSDSPHVVRLCSKLDHSTNPPSYTYRIQPGISRESDGLVVASQYGVNKDYLSALLTQKEKRGDLKLR